MQVFIWEIIQIQIKNMIFSRNKRLKNEIMSDAVENDADVK